MAGSFTIRQLKTILALFEISFVLVRFNHVASRIVNAPRFVGGISATIDRPATASTTYSAILSAGGHRRLYHFVIAVWRAKEAQSPPREVMGDTR